MSEMRKYVLAEKENQQEMIFPLAFYINEACPFEQPRFLLFKLISVFTKRENYGIITESINRNYEARYEY